jgi:hypothetical protein
MDSDKHQRNNLLVRIAGLFCIGLIGMMVVGCGLALAFGDYRLSMVLFFIVVAMLVFIKLVTRIL